MAREKKNTTRFSTLVLVLVVASFVFGGAAGAVMYASGKAVLESPPHMAMVSHTEYAFSAPGQIIARIVDFKGDAVAVDNCTSTILYPNKTALVSAALMSATGTISSDYYYSFTTPAGPEGTYEYQATCYYGVGKNASVTNSFHLTGNLNAIIGNLTNISGNIVALSGQLSGVNSTLSAQLTGLAAQLNANATTLIDQMNANTSGVYAQLNANVTTVLSALSAVNASLVSQISGLNISVNLTPILDQLTAVNNSIASEFAGLHASLGANFSSITNSLSGINATVTANNVVLTSVNASVVAMQSVLDAVNVTSVNTYTYVTTTLAGKVDDVLTGLGVINATVNRIEATTVQINTTVDAIKANQEGMVIMQVSSG